MTKIFFKDGCAEPLVLVPACDCCLPVFNKQFTAVQLALGIC